MMNYDIFKEVVKEKFMDYMPEKFKGMELVAEPVEKVNVTLDGIILREEGRNISPTIYINDMYKKYQEDRKSTRLNSSHRSQSRMPSSA